MSCTPYSSKMLLDHLLSAGAFVSMHTDDPGKTGDCEVSGGKYSRKTVVFGAWKEGSRTNQGIVKWEKMPKAEVTHLGLWDAKTGGNFLLRIKLDGSQAYEAGDSAKIESGALKVAA